MKFEKFIGENKDFSMISAFYSRNGLRVYSNDDVFELVHIARFTGGKFSYFSTSDDKPHKAKYVRDDKRVGWPATAIFQLGDGSYFRCSVDRCTKKQLKSIDDDHYDEKMIEKWINLIALEKFEVENKRLGQKDYNVSMVYVDVGDVSLMPAAAIAVSKGGEVSARSYPQFGSTARVWADRFATASKIGKITKEFLDYWIDRSSGITESISPYYTISAETAADAAEILLVKENVYADMVINI